MFVLIFWVIGLSDRKGYATHVRLFKQNILTIKQFNILYQAYSPLAEVGILFPPTLRFATHWAELTHS
ncbi:hypothetical protein TF3313_0680 [Tannerella forsythia 3313]|nr:hypothetical protein TF3313_0680 [Tannerella forsythia 3313]